MSDLAKQFNLDRKNECVSLKKNLEGAALAYVTFMAQGSLDPETYDKFCTAHDQLVLNRRLSNSRLSE